MIGDGKWTRMIWWLHVSSRGSCDSANGPQGEGVTAVTLISKRHRPFVIHCAFLQSLSPITVHLSFITISSCLLSLPSFRMRSAIHSGRIVFDYFLACVCVRVCVCVCVCEFKWHFKEKQPLIVLTTDAFLWKDCPVFLLVSLDAPYPLVGLSDCPFVTLKF